MAQKTPEEIKAEKERLRLARQKSLKTAKTIGTFPGKVSEFVTTKIVDGGLAVAGAGPALVKRLKYEEYVRELKAAEIEYRGNPTAKNKKRLDIAREEFSEVQEVKDKEENKNVSSPRGQGKTETFNPKEDRPRGEQRPSDSGKTNSLQGTPTFIPINPLDNNRWKTGGLFDNVKDDEFSIYFTQDKTMNPISFLPNDVGSIYQTSTGSPESFDNAVSRIINEFSSAGKMNELRDLFITSKIASTPAMVGAMKFAKDTPNSGYNGLDPNTRLLVARSVQLATIANITAVSTPGAEPETFMKWLRSYKGEVVATPGSGGSGQPRRTVNFSKQVYSPEDLELNIDAFFQEYTGQGASKEDLDFLVKRLNAQPAQKTVTTRKGNNTTSVTTGGVSQQEEQLRMRDMALKDPQAESYNKATTYLNYFREALASPIELG